MTARPREPSAALRAQTRIRPARPDDVAELLEIINLAYVRERWLIPGPRIDLAELEHELASPQSSFLVAESGGQRQGTVRVRWTIDDPDAAVPQLGLLAVHPRAQGAGLASLLVQALESLVSDAGHDALYLECGRELGLTGYYERLGYCEVRASIAERWGSKQPFALVTMKKALREL
jgi:predicted N-acetyltransferase YhbS